MPVEELVENEITAHLKRWPLANGSLTEMGLLSSLLKMTAFGLSVSGRRILKVTVALHANVNKTE